MRKHRDTWGRYAPEETVEPIIDHSGEPARRTRTEELVLDELVTTPPVPDEKKVTKVTFYYDDGSQRSFLRHELKTAEFQKAIKKAETSGDIPMRLWQNTLITEGDRIYWTDMDILQKAREFGYMGDDPAEAGKLLSSMFKPEYFVVDPATIGKLVQKPALDAKGCWIPVTKKEYDSYYATIRRTRRTSAAPIAEEPATKPTETETT